MVSVVEVFFFFFSFFLFDPQGRIQDDQDRR